MDDKMMQQLLQSYNAPMTARNANLAREFFAANPDIAERRAMGMRGSALDDNSDLLSSYLDKVIAESTIPQGRVEVGAPRLADSPPATTNSAPAGTARPSPPSRPTKRGAENLGETGGEPMVSGRDSMKPNPYPTVRDPRDTATFGVDPQTSAGGSSGGGLSDWLLAALGLSSLAGKGMMNGQARLPAPNPPSDTKLLTGPEQKRLGYEPKLEDQDYARVQGRRDTEYPSGAPKLDEKAVQRSRGMFQDPAEVERMKAEVEAENRLLMEQAKQLQDQREAEALKLKKQKLAQETARAAKQAVGRR